MANDLTDIELRICHVLAEGGTVRGFELKKNLGLESKELVDAVKPLIEKRLITPSGIVTCETIDRVHFSPLSSMSDALHLIK
jgi:hypothetical protein